MQVQTCKCRKWTAAAQVSQVACRGSPLAAPGRRRAGARPNHWALAVLTQSELKCASEADASSQSNYLGQKWQRAGKFKSRARQIEKSHAAGSRHAEIAQRFLFFLSPYLFIFIQLVFKFSNRFSDRSRIFQALRRCWKRSISSPLDVLKLYDPTFNLFLLEIQAEISFHEPSIFTFDLCNLWFVSVDFHCQITIISEVLLRT
jgi:hypothetical protein